MTSLTLANLAIGGLVVRHLFVLGALLRSRRFLLGKQRPAITMDKGGALPVFYLVVPVLREAVGLREAVSHFRALANSQVSAQVIIVTTAREKVEAVKHADAADTVAIAKGLACKGKVIHLHYPDPLGLKADQLNLAVDYCMTSLPKGVSLERAFLVFYDADSRPPLDSLTQFENAIARHPEVSVFHQSSRFELRPARSGKERSVLTRFTMAIADSGALRTNRFVFAYELPRLLNRLNTAGVFKRRACSYVYAHVTGHGLCVRLSFLKELPFPARSPLEDMHYSFLLGARKIPIMPIVSLDRAEVPDSVRTQFQQLSRWFFGPARFLRYLSDPATPRGWRARFLAVSAAGITIGWLSCSILPLLLTFLLSSGEDITRALIGFLVVIHIAQLAIVDQAVGFPTRVAARAQRIVLYPVACTLFGIAGLVGAGRLVRGESGAGKTERRCKK